MAIWDAWADGAWATGAWVIEAWELAHEIAPDERLVLIPLELRTAIATPEDQ